MSVVSIPLRQLKWRIYAIVCETSEKEFVVKIGVTSTPYERYQTLLVGIPHKSVMLHALVGTKKKTYGLEAKLHQIFKERNMRGEWFRFSLEDKEQFHRIMKIEYLAATKKQLAWERIYPEQVSAYAEAVRQMKSLNRRKYPISSHEYTAYRYGK